MIRYNAAQAAGRVGVTAAAISRYCEQHLIPEAQLAPGGEWWLTPQSLDWVRIVKALRLSGASLAAVRIYVAQRDRPAADAPAWESLKHI